jgi:hypothetical protein
MTKKSKNNPLLSPGFLLRHNDKKYYTTVGITLGIIILLITIIGIFVPTEATIKIPGEPTRVFWPKYINEDGSATCRQIFDPDVNKPGNPNNSLMVLDKWSLTHITHGIIGYFIFLLIKFVLKADLSITIGFIIMLIIEVSWEYYENTTKEINQYRKANQFETYSGDSIVNSLGDILSCLFGFLFASISPAAAIAYVAISEPILWPNGLIGGIYYLF